MNAMKSDNTLPLELKHAHLVLVRMLQIVRACGYLSRSDSEQLRTNLFRLGAQYRAALPGLMAARDRAECQCLRNGQEALCRAGLCLMSGASDGPGYVRVDIRRLAACISDLEPAVALLTRTPRPLPQHSA
jgi:hypothetical protein